jgi:hypothetical protein
MLMEYDRFQGCIGVPVMFGALQESRDGHCIDISAPGGVTVYSWNAFE